MKLIQLPGMTPRSRSFGRRGAVCGALWLRLLLAVAATGATVSSAGAHGDTLPTLRWSSQTDSLGSSAGPPLVMGPMVYVLSGYPHTLYAYDVNTPATPLKWSVRLASGASGYATTCCRSGAHGPVADGRGLLVTTADGRVVALDAHTGEVQWDVQVTAPEAGETLQGPPSVAGTWVLVGNAGDDYGVRGWVAALRRDSGQVAWKRFSTGPDQEVGIGERFAATTSDRARDRGVTSWPPDGWRNGGGTVSNTILIDAATQTLFHSTGHPAPWNAQLRAGDNRWTSGLFARDLATGDARWFVSFNPNNPFAFREGQDLLLAAPGDRPASKQLLHVDGNGWAYLIDAGDGRVVSADRLDDAGVATVGQDRQTRYAQRPQLNRASRSICPSWRGTAAAPLALIAEDVVVVSLDRLCMDFEPRAANYIKGTPYLGANVRLRLPGRGAAGALVAWDLRARRPRWRIDEAWPVLGGAAVQAQTVIYATLDGWLKGVDSATGRQRWQMSLGQGVISTPVVVEHAGQHYVVVIAGVAAVDGMLLNEAADSRDATAAMGWASLLSQLPVRDPHMSVSVYQLP